MCARSELTKEFLESNDAVGKIFPCKIFFKVSAHCALKFTVNKKIKKIITLRRFTFHPPLPEFSPAADFFPQKTVGVFSSMHQIPPVFQPQFSFSYHNDRLRKFYYRVKHSQTLDRVNYFAFQKLYFPVSISLLL